MGFQTISPIVSLLEKPRNENNPQKAVNSATTTGEIWPEASSIDTCPYLTAKTVNKDINTESDQRCIFISKTYFFNLYPIT